MGAAGLSGAYGWDGPDDQWFGAAGKCGVEGLLAGVRGTVVIRYRKYFRYFRYRPCGVEGAGQRLLPTVAVPVVTSVSRLRTTSLRRSWLMV